MKKAEDMRWIVHPFSYRDKSEISVIHESDFHGLKSYGWFSETKILIGHDSIYGNVSDDVKDMLIGVAEFIAEKMNKERPIPISDVQDAIDAYIAKEERAKEIFKPVAERFKKAFEDALLEAGNEEK